MTFSSFPINSQTVFVADTSFIINLNATGCAEEIIQSQPGKMLITTQVFAELVNGEYNGYKDAEKAEFYIKRGLMEQVNLGEDGFKIYGDLIEGSTANTLDDGEASVIGCTFERGAIALIDEKKARRICREHYPQIPVHLTIDFFMHSQILTNVGEEKIKNAIIKALKNARMHIPKDKYEIVIPLIGEKI